MQQAPIASHSPLSRSRIAVLCTICCALLSSCSEPSVSVRALAPVNVNAEGESLPVKVRIYALRDDARFRAAPFADLWTKDRDVLGDDRLQDPKVVVVPPASLKVEPQLAELSELPKEARFLGVVALIPHADQPDRRRVVIARKDIGSQIIDLVDSSIVVHDRGDPVPGRTAPRDEPATPVAAQPAAAPPAASPAPAPAPAAPAAVSGPSASGAAAGAGTPADAAPPAKPGGAHGNQMATSGKSSAGRGRGTTGQGQ